MEWKVIVGQCVVGAIVIACVFMKQDSGLVHMALGGLLTSIGYPAVVATIEKKAATSD